MRHRGLRTHDEAPSLSEENHLRANLRILTLVALVVGSMWAPAACAQEQPPPKGLPLLGDRLRTRPPSSDGACRFDMSGDKEQTVFFVLGFLDEYLGRNVVEDDDRIESLYGQEVGPSAALRRQLQKLAAEQGLETTIREETDASGPVVFRSKPIADRINSCYRYQMRNDTAVQARDGSYRRMAHASPLDRALFLKSGQGSRSIRGNGLPDEVFHRRRALAYVAGAWTRYRRGNDLAFANSKDKATLIAQLLTDLGCRGVKLETTFGYIPQSNVLRFTPTDEVREWLGRTW